MSYKESSLNYILQRGIGSPMDGYDPEFDNKEAHPWKSWTRRVRYSPLRVIDCLLIRCRLGSKPSHRALVTMSSVRIASLSPTYVVSYLVFTGPYRWLAENCAFLLQSVTSLLTHRYPDKDGDKICIFGFSRGAYTARVCVPPHTAFEESYV
jgi:hypothetical protein